MRRLRIEVPESEDGERLDAVLARVGGLSRTLAGRLVAEGSVTVDGQPAPKAYRLSSGQVVEAEVVPDQVPSPDEQPEVEVVWEDDHLLVVEKPSGLVVHGAPGLREPTLVTALAATGRPLAPRAGEERPGVVHRLDREVSGLLVVAKSDRAHEALVDAMSGRRVRRHYVALVAGSPATDRGTIDAPIGRHSRHRTRMATVASGKPAVTHFRVRERFREASLLDVQLETGRTHQIRVHLEAVGHPIVGDPHYANDPTLARRLGLARPFLHAAHLELDHPVGGRPLAFDSPLPPELAAALEEVAR
ncbi:MAG TPA: RluA family pseudouridine synthase [Actinomycetota bacterium]|nr:RluA family pseudouridine synthase [Actinomycetota bacterium]